MRENEAPRMRNFEENVLVEANEAATYTIGIPFDM